MRYLLVGNYGVGNLGDEALKEYFLQAFPEVDWLVVSASPQGNELPRLPGGIRSFLSLSWFRTLKALRKSDGIVFGGGSLFTDTESVYACFLWWWHAFVARLFGKPVFLAFQGIGPFKTRVGEWCARSVASRAAFLSVRDEASFERVRSWGSSTKIVQTFDPVFSLVHNKKQELSSQKVFIVIPRKNSGESFRRRAQEIIGNEEWEKVRILSIQPDDENERAFCEELREGIGISTEIVPIQTLNQLVEEIARASFVLAHRYHGALAALALEKDVEIISQGEGDKLDVLKRMVSSRGSNDLLGLIEEGTGELKEMLTCLRPAP